MSIELLKDHNWITSVSCGCEAIRSEAVDQFHLPTACQSDLGALRLEQDVFDINAEISGCVLDLDVT